MLETFTFQLFQQKTSVKALLHLQKNPTIDTWFGYW